MKKFLFYFLPLVAALSFTACDDDKDLPSVDFNFDIENATRVDGQLYIAQEDTLKIESITVNNLEEGQKAIITEASYYWDYYYIGTNVRPPYGFELFIDKETPVGHHTLQVSCPVFANKKTPARAIVTFDVQVVADKADIPEAGESSFRVTPQTSEE